MLNEPGVPVLRMIRRAATIYKRLYGAYPETIGLDVFTCFKEWQQTSYFDAYFFREVAHPVPTVFDRSTTIPIATISIQIAPVTFSPIKYNEYRTDPRPTDPKQGKNGVWCKRGEHEIAIDLILTSSGYHAVIAEQSDLDAWK